MNLTEEQKQLLNTGSGVVDLGEGVPIYEFPTLSEIMNTAREAIKSAIVIYLTGDSGTGKTHLGQALALERVKELNKERVKRGEAPSQVRYIQLDDMLSKSSFIGGYKLTKEGIKTELAPFGQAMLMGDTIIIDEITHANHSLLVLMNSALDRTSIMNAGDYTFQAHPDFRVIVLSNPSRYAGNTTIPQSLANRLFTIKMDYPPEEAEFQVVKATVKRIVPDRKNVSDGLVKFITFIGRTVRHNIPVLPVSARSIANTCAILEVVYSLLVWR